MNNNGKIKINYVDIIQQQIFLAEVVWKNGIIKEISHLGNANTAYHYLIPGFIDAHVPYLPRRTMQRLVYTLTRR